MQQLLILFFAILSINSIHAQRVSNNEFTWINNADCAYSGETFVAVMVKPQILSHKEIHFANDIEIAIQNIELAQSTNGSIRLKVRFEKGNPVCIGSIGQFDININSNKLKSLFNALPKPIKFESGKQAGIDVNCQGIITIKIQHGIVSDIDFVNLTFNH